MKAPQLAQLGFIVAAAIAVYSFVATARDGERRRVCGPLCHLQPNYSARNRSAPDFELPAVSGKKIKLSNYRGKVVILNFWTKNCRPCLEEMPSFAELAQTLRKDSGVAVITVSTDDGVDDARGTLRSVLGNDGAFETAVDPDSEIVGKKYGTRLYPETWFVDPQGVIRARFDGGRDWSNPIILDLIASLKEPSSCSVALESGRMSGTDAPLCEDITG